MNRAIGLILITALILVSGPAIAAADRGGAILIADTTTDASSDVKTTESKATEISPPPAIMIPDPLFTFNAVVDGSEVVHDFRVYNRGKGELAIEKVQTG